MSDRETFRRDQVIDAVENYLRLGVTYANEHQGQRGGYFTGDGWAARCLRWHLEQLKTTPAGDSLDRELGHDASADPFAPRHG